MPAPKPRDSSMAGPYQRLADGQRFTAARRIEPARAEARSSRWKGWAPWALLAVLLWLRWWAHPAPIPAGDPSLAPETLKPGTVVRLGEPAP